MSKPKLALYIVLYLGLLCAIAAVKVALKSRQTTHLNHNSVALEVAISRFDLLRRVHLEGSRAFVLLVPDAGCHNSLGAHLGDCGL
jgi:hypothetical protein